MRRKTTHRVRLSVLLAVVLPLSLAGCKSRNIGADASMSACNACASDMALSALSKGDMSGAEKWIPVALSADPRDPYALLAAALLYQNTNRPQEAIQVYQTLVSLDPSQQAVLGEWFSLQERPIADIARSNLDVLRLGFQTPPVSPAGGGSMGSGSMGIHLASYKSEADARKGWNTLQRQFPALLAKKTPDYPTVSIPTKGVFVRLVIGTFERGTAQNLCTSLKQSGQYCALVRM